MPDNDESTAVTLWLVLRVVLNWPEYKTSLSADQPAHGVFVPSNDMPNGIGSSDTVTLCFSVDVNWPDVMYNLSPEYPIHGVSGVTTTTLELDDELDEEDHELSDCEELEALDDDEALMLDELELSSTAA